MFPAFLKLRKMDPDTERPYKVPGGEGVLKVMAWLPFIQIVLCLILTCVPLAFDAETLAGTLPITIGAILIIIIDEVYIRVKGTPTSAPTFRLSTPPPKRTRSRVRNREALLFHGPRRAVTRRGLFQSREEHVMRNSKLLAAGSAILVSFAVAVANAIASGERIGMLPIMLLTHLVLAGGYMIFSALTEQPEAASEPLDEAAASTALPDATSKTVNPSILLVTSGLTLMRHAQARDKLLNHNHAACGAHEPRQLLVAAHAALGVHAVEVPLDGILRDEELAGQIAPCHA